MFSGLCTYVRTYVVDPIVLFGNLTMLFYTSQAASACAHSDALPSHVAFFLDTTCKQWTRHVLMQQARMISGAGHRRYVRTYVRTYVRMCSCRHSARNCTHRAHWIQDAILQYTYVRSGPNRAGGFNEQKCSPAELFRSIIFNVVNGHVELQAKDYSAVSKMDARLQFLKPCVLIYKYMTEFDKKFPAGVNKGSKAFIGRKERVTCTPYQIWSACCIGATTSAAW